MAAFQYSCRMICAVIWKSWRIRKHRKWQTFVEIAIPVLLVLLLVAVKAFMEPEDDEIDRSRPQTFPQNDMTSLISKLCKIGCSTGERNAAIVYAPKTNFTEKLMKDVSKILEQNGALVEVDGLQDEQQVEALTYLLRSNGSGHFGRPTILTGAVIFVNHTDTSDILTYKIRLLTSKFVSGKTFAETEMQGPGKHYAAYEETGFLGLQLAVDQAYTMIVNANNSLPLPSYALSTQAFPYPPYKRHDKIQYSMVLATLLPAVIIIGYVHTICISVKVIVEERFSGVKKFLTMLGLSHIGYWISWFCDLALVSVFTMILIVVILTTDISGEGAVIVSSSSEVIWAFLMLYVLASLWFCFFIATMIQSTKYAKSMAAVIWFGSFLIPSLLVGMKSRYLATQYLISIFPNMCLYWGFHIIAAFEANVVGAHWHNLEAYANASDSLNLASIFAMLVFSGIFYFALTLLIQHHRQANRKLKCPYTLLYDVLYDDTSFPELVHCISRGCKRKSSTLREEEERLTYGQDVLFDSPVGNLRTAVLQRLGLVKDESIGDENISRHTLTEGVEVNDPTKDCGVKVRNLSKSFHAEKVLRRFSCDFYTNEISCILGDSGAGKTVLVDILLGALKADEGTAYVNEYDIHDYLIDVRRSVGFCPQNNLLFPDLTVREHLIMFGWLKGKDLSAAYAQANHIISILKLKDKAKVPASKLSKQYKRFLCCGIAFMGEPQVLIFDNPTQDLDRDSSKTLWNMLLKYKEDRTIIFTSSSIEDAAAIADRIAIVKDGKLRCCGSAQYLNTLFGDGYTIRLSISGTNAEWIVRMISQEIGQAELKNRTLTVGGEDVTFVVPNEYVPTFPKLFYQLYDHKDEFGLITVQIDSLTVDDLFHSVHEMQEFESQPSKLASTTDGKSHFFVGRKTEGCCLSINRLWALILKNYRLSTASMKFLIFLIIIPIALILSGITGANRGLRNQDVHKFGKINIGLGDYKKPITTFSIENNSLGLAYKGVVGSGGVALMPKSNLSEDLLKIGEQSISKYRQNHIVAALEMDNKIKAMYSTVALHGAPLSINLVSNAILKSLNLSKKIIVENHPIKNYSNSDESKNITHDGGTSALLKAFCFYFAYAVALICAGCAVKPMLERVSGSHHIQTMTGISPFTFWMSYLILDGLYILLFSGFALFLVYVCQERNMFTMNGGAFALFLILWIGGLASICFAYFFSQMVNEAWMTFGFLNVIHLLAALGSYIIYHTHDGIDDAFTEIYFWLTTPFPVPFMIHALFIYGRVAVDNSQCQMIAKSSVCHKKGIYMYLPAFSCCEQCTNNCFVAKSYFNASYGYESYTLLRDLVVLGIVAVTYLIIVILRDYNYFQKLGRYFLSAPSEAFIVDKGEKDASAAQEAEHVRKLIGMGGSVPQNEGLLVDGLCKNYGTIGVYSHVSFSVKKGECFGILGGAGKSAVFRTLTGQQVPSVGDAHIPPYSMLHNRRKFTSLIGYCPQENCVFSGLTASQTLELYGSLKGIHKADLKREVRQWLSSLGLENDGNRLCGDFTPGMKRRLSVAIALLGDPIVIILDEPSRDLDPTMKKHIWITLRRLQKEGKVILLASQNVHECENLCAKLGLMINGRLQYVGTTRAIKNKFLNGYTVTFKLTKRYSVDDSSELETVSEIKNNIEAILDDALFRDVFQNTLKYLIPQKGQNWGSIVEKLERIRIGMKESVAYYSLTESTLEEVALAMSDLDVDSQFELPGTRVTPLQRICMGQCCTDDYS